MATCKVVFMTPRRAGLGPSAVLITRDMRSINYIDYPAGTRLTAAEKRRVTKQLMKGCKELSRRPRGFRDGEPAKPAAPAAPAPAAKPVAGWWPFGKKKPKRNPMSRRMIWEPGTPSRMFGRSRKRRRR